MSLDLHLHEVIPQTVTCGACEVINVQDFPEEFKAKFADYIFVEVVEVADWPSTIETIIGIYYSDFSRLFELFLEADEKFFFAPKGCENPMNSPNLLVIDSAELMFISSEHPHINIRRLGYQRHGMKDKFFEKFSNNQVVTDFEVVKSMLAMCDSVDSMENFSENFVSGWTDTSFVMVQY